MRFTIQLRGWRARLALAVLALAVLSVPGAGIRCAAASYKVTVLTSDQPGAPFLDTNLQNPWGLASSATSPFWISDNATSMATIYDGTGSPFPLVIGIPGPGGTKGLPTGVVFNSTGDFSINGAPAAFLFASQEGTILGWNASTSTVATIVAGTFGARYTGLAIASNGQENLLYAANFLGGRIDVFNTNFFQVTIAGNFTDPNLPSGYAPFNIAVINNHLFVTYAWLNADKTGVAFCTGCGFVDSYDMNGNFVKRFASRGALNAPWGIAVAPGNFGTFSGDVLIGNLGDGKINAYLSAKFIGPLVDSTKAPIVIKRLRGLRFGNGGNGGLKKELFFTAGPGSSLHGQFGKITFQ
jgi:uncharacterized protein (TIGR03118 family)